MADNAELVAARARIAAKATELMIENPDVSVSGCLSLAAHLEEIVHGVPGAPPPRGILHSEDCPCRS